MDATPDPTQVSMEPTEAVMWEGRGKGQGRGQVIRASNEDSLDQVMAVEAGSVA